MSAVVETRTDVVADSPNDAPIDGASTSLTVADRIRARRSGVRTAFALVSSLYLGVQLCLVAWVAVPALALGWTPRVVTSDSMAPSITAGDIVLADRDPDAGLTVGALVEVDRAGGAGTNIHRVVEIEDDRYRTKGDANDDFDPHLAERSEVQGVGRLLVPIVGTPAMWWQTGRYLPVALWALSIVASLTAARRRPLRKAAA